MAEAQELAESAVAKWRRETRPAIRLDLEIEARRALMALGEARRDLREFDAWRKAPAVEAPPFRGRRKVRSARPTEERSRGETED